MACEHNQAKINELSNQIDKLKEQIVNLNNNIIKCEEISKKHVEFNEKISCVDNNLVGNTVIAGKSYDNGKMMECLNTINDNITDCKNIIKESVSKITLLEEDISSLEHRIASLQGNCYSCSLNI